MESTVEVFGQKIKESLSQMDDTKLQLKLQSAQHAHELRMMTLFTQFLAGRRSHQPEMPLLHLGHTTQSSSYPDHVHPPLFGQDYARAPPFHQDHVRPPPFHQDHTLPIPNDAHPLPPFYQDYASAGPSHHSHPPFIQEDHTHLLPPFHHDTQPSPSHQAHIHSQPIIPAQPMPSTPPAAI
uniref:Uncharacterized protein n=1 Tax=Anguilla anguilla TaxID=7936 RepID=A0A0E9WXY4_ANGAN